MIIKNRSSETVTLRLQKGGVIYLGPNKSVERSDVANLSEVEDKVKLSENLTEVITHVDGQGSLNG